jgi:hypothetical protein
MYRPARRRRITRVNPQNPAGHACQLEQPWLFDQYMIEFLKKRELFPVN